MKPQAEPKYRKGIQAAVFVAAVLLIIAGIANGGALDVLVKAINICTECIGLG
ncbi:MAG: thioredoxin [Clostridia bacterium]|nr:thioredoxin [Clostridia bacterium]